MDNSQACSKKSSSATFATISTISMTDRSETKNFISKIILYYVAWLKKFCDWSFIKWVFQTTDNRNFVSDMKTSKSSKMIGKHILEKNTKQQLKIVKRKLKSNVDTDTGSDGRINEKKQATKVILRCLKCGHITGILRKEGSVFRIHPRYMLEYDYCEKPISSSPESLPPPSKTPQPKISQPKNKAKELKTSKKSNYCRNSQMKSENKLGNLTPRISDIHFNMVNKESDESVKSNGTVKTAKPKQPRISLKRRIRSKQQRKQHTRSQRKSPTISKFRSKLADKNFKPKKVVNRINKVNSGSDFFSSKSSRSTVSTCVICSKKSTKNLQPRRKPKKNKKTKIKSMNTDL